jgi:hypothetical protein
MPMSCHSVGYTDAVNGVSLHPTHPLLATATGQRHFDIGDLSDDSSRCAPLRASWQMA